MTDIRGPVAVVHFSGTGGARRVARAIEGSIEASGLSAVDRALDRSPGHAARSGGGPGIADCDAFVLVFPLHAFDAPEPVYRWLETVEGRGRPAAVVSVSAGGEPWPNRGCRALVTTALEGRGFEVTYETMMIMPCNWVVPVSDDVAIHLLRAVPGKAERIVTAFLAGERRRTHHRLGWPRRLVSRLEKRSAGRFSRRVEITEACTGCTWCEKNCPEANIRMQGKRPVIGAACVMCFRCVYGCPVGAMKAHDFQVLAGGFDLAAVEKRMAGREPAAVAECCKGWLWSGLRAYLEDREA
jgi:ferredoxin